MSGTPVKETAYLAPAGLVEPLTAELRNVTAVHDRLILAKGGPQPTVWAENVWLDPVRIPIASIGDAAKRLKALQRNWWPYSYQLHRRIQLIQEQLPHVAAKPLEFPDTRVKAPLGSYTLLDQDTLLASPNCTSLFPNGEPRFRQFKEGPPSRAYLKLFEALTRIGTHPAAGETCVELGASPGGWTWVLARLGAQVIAYDRADLDPSLMRLPNVKAVKGDAFAATPDKVGAIDWLFSDIICYPERMLEHARLWLDSGLCKNFVCTVKFQGTAHYGVIPEFLKIPGSQLFHLFHNKHELTWVRLA